MEYTRGVFGVLNMDEMEGQPLVLLDGGIERRFREPYVFHNACRPEYTGYLLQYTLRGEGWFERGGRRHRISEGKGFLAEVPGNSRYYLEENSPVPWEFFYLHFQGAAVRPFARKLERLSQGVFSMDAGSQPMRQALKLQERMLRGDHLQKYEGGEFLYSFLCGLLREAEHPSAGAKGSLAGRAAAVMEEEYMRLQGVEEVARRLRVSPEHLARAFRAQKGLSPVRYLNSLRIQAAMNELLDTEDTVEQIARRNGFSGGNYFGKVFAKSVGMAPGEYRKRRTLQGEEASLHLSNCVKEAEHE